MDYYDPFGDEPRRSRGCSGSATRWLLVSFDTDWRFPTSHSIQIARVLRRAGREVTHHEVSSPWGHDSFLLPVTAYLDLVEAFLAQARPVRSLAPRSRGRGRCASA